MKYSEVKDFNYDDCFKLGCLIVEKHDKHKEPIAIEFIWMIWLSSNILCKAEMQEIFHG